jgi:hypothetical protein
VPEQARGMHSTDLIEPRAASSGARPDARPSASDAPTVGEVLGEIIPVVGVVAGAGPPVVFVLGPWLLLALMLAGPFAVLVTLVVAMLVAAGLAAAIVAVPYLLIRVVHRHRAGHALTGGRTAALDSFESPGAVA